MNTMLRHILPALCLLLFLGQNAASAPVPHTLLAIEESSAGDTGRIDIDFTDLPPYRILISEDRLDLTLQNTRVGKAIPKTGSGDIIREIKHKDGRGQSVVSFYFKRQPLRVNAAFVLKDAAPSDSSAKLSARLSLDVTYKPEPVAPPPPESPETAPEPGENTDNSAAPEVSKTRPSISGDLPGREAAIAGFIAAKQITSPFKGRWKDFFSEYRTPLSIPVDIRYSLPPFPVISLAGTGMEKSYLSPLVLAQGRAGIWDDVLTVLERQSAEAMTSEMKTVVFLAYADALLRNGNPVTALNTLNMIPAGQPETRISEWARYLKAVTLASAGQPYQAAYELDHFHRPQDSAPTLTPYLDMARVETALATKQYDEAQKILNKDKTGYPEDVRTILSLRQADLWALTDRSDRAASYYSELEKQKAILSSHPFSLALYAETLRTHGRNAEATNRYNRLAAVLAHHPGESLALFAEAESLGAAASQTGNLFQDIIDRHPGTEGAIRARLKTADLAVLADTDNKKLHHLMAEYKEISAIAPLRQLREEAALKEALTMYLSGDLVRAAHLIQSFIRDYASGPLSIHGQTMMIELLPVTVRELVSGKEYLKALVLAEQNRDLLVSGQISSDFLSELGLAFAGLCIWNRAIRVYSYILDISRGTPAEEGAYLPLIEVLLASESHDQVEAYATHYLKHYPAGHDLTDILRLRAESLHKSGKTRQAGDIIQQYDITTSRTLNSLAARIFWDLEEYGLVEKHLSRNMGTDLSGADPGDIFLRAESLFKTGRTDQALPFFTFLIDIPDQADQALYRAAQIHLARKERGQGVKLLQRLAEEGKSPLWKKMAAETLAINAELETSR